MFKFVQRYTKATLAVLVAMIGYRLVVVPLVIPAEPAKPEIPAFTQMLHNDRWWEEFFPPGSWQTQNPKIVHTDKGILLSHTWTPVDEKKWDLHPLTIILPPSEAARAAVQSRDPAQMAGHDMWIVSAENGATIHFEEPFEPLGVTSSNVPVVTRGDLSGKIEVFRRAAKETPEKPWRLVTYDLTIDRRQLSTTREVVIEWGESVIKGRDLKVLLQGDLLGNQGSNSSAWGPLDELELYQVDQIDVALPPGGIWADMNVSALEEKPGLRNLPARIHGTCGGRFAFDFGSSTATLQNGVRLAHRLEGMPADEFQCDHIEIEVEPPDRSRSPDDKVGRSSGVGGIVVKSLHATGVDSLRDFVGEKWVEVKARTIDLMAKAKSLRVNLETQRVELDGQLNAPGATQSVAVLNYLGNEFRSPQILYQAAPEDPSGNQHLGWMVAQGPGELRTSAETEFGASQIRWERSLRMAPVPESPDRHWIELDGSTLVESPERGLLASDNLQVWLQQVSTESGDASITSSQMSSDISYRPVHIHAKGKTLLTTNAMRAEVAQLDLGMLYAPEVDKPPPEEGLALSDSAGNPMYQWVSPPAQSGGDVTAPTSAPTAADSAAQRATSDPISVAGDHLQAQLVASGKDTWIDQLTLSGPVRVWKTQPKNPKEFPWTVTGDQLALATDRSGAVDMQIEGQPAQVQVAEGSLVGTVIRFDQRQNLVWMNDPGEFTVPLSAIQDARPGRSSTLQWLDAPYCSWQGRMVFDGSAVQIEGDIEFKATFRNRPDRVWWTKGVAQRMQIFLSETADFR